MFFQKKLRNYLAVSIIEKYKENTNMMQSFKWYKMAAEQNYAPAYNKVAECYQLGCGVPKKPAEAVKWHICHGVALPQSLFGQPQLFVENIF